MADIPHADGPYSENIAFGIYKATALELLRRTLDQKQLGWLSALSECQMRLKNGEWLVTAKFRTTKGWKYGATITLQLRDQTDKKVFPFSHGLVNLQDSSNPDFWSISETGDITYV